MLSLRVGPADSFALTDDRELLAQTLGTISAYDLADGALRWQADQERPTYRLRTADGLVLMRPWTYGPGQPSTTALSLATGAAAVAARGHRDDPARLVQPCWPSRRSAAAAPTAGSRARSSRSTRAPAAPAGASTCRPPPCCSASPARTTSGARMMLLHDDRTAAVHDLGTGAADHQRRVAAGQLRPGEPDRLRRAGAAAAPRPVRRRW